MESENNLITQEETLLQQFDLHYYDEEELKQISDKKDHQLTKA